MERESKFFPNKNLGQAKHKQSPKQKSIEIDDFNISPIHSDSKSPKTTKGGYKDEIIKVKEERKDNVSDSGRKSKSS